MTPIRFCTFGLLAILAITPTRAMVGGAPSAADGAGRSVVMILGEGGTQCTATAIARDLLLTAAHPDWGWGTDDSAQALTYLKRFGSVTVLNGHIHQIMQKVEGNFTFHTARSTAFPQPAPGQGPSPGPIKDFPPDKLGTVLGIASVTFKQNEQRLAIVDSSLQG